MKLKFFLKVSLVIIFQMLSISSTSLASVFKTDTPVIYKGDNKLSLWFYDVVEEISADHDREIYAFEIQGKVYTAINSVGFVLNGTSYKAFKRSFNFIEKDGEKSLIWHGVVKEDPEMTISFAASTNSNESILHIRDGEKISKIAKTISSTHLHVERDDIIFNRKTAVHLASSEEVPIQKKRSKTLTEGLYYKAADVDENVVDILVGYTEESFKTSGLTKEEFEQELIVYFDQINLAFENNNISKDVIRTRVAGLQQVSYTTPETGLNTTLSSLNNGDNGLEELHQKREDLNADIISLITIDPTEKLCGVAYTPTLQDNGIPSYLPFMVVAYKCLSGYTHIHEFGHLIGLDHDYENRNPNGAGLMQDINHGYRVNGIFRTTMAYACEGEEDNKCPRIPYFSHPEQTYSFGPGNTYALGDNRSKNVDVIIEYGQYLSKISINDNLDGSISSSSSNGSRGGGGSMGIPLLDIALYKLMKFDKKQEIIDNLIIYPIRKVQ